MLSYFIHNLTRRIKNSLMRLYFWIFGLTGLVIFFLFHDPFILAVCLVPMLMFEGQEALPYLKRLPSFLSRLYVFEPIVLVCSVVKKILWLKPKKKIVFYKNLLLFRLAKSKTKSFRNIREIKEKARIELAGAEAEKSERENRAQREEAELKEKEEAIREKQEIEPVAKNELKSGSSLFNKILRKLFIQPLKSLLKLPLKIILLPLNLFKKTVKKLLRKKRKSRAEEDQAELEDDEEPETGQESEAVLAGKIEEPDQTKQEDEEEFKAGESASFNRIKKQTIKETGEESEKNRFRKRFFPRNVLKQAAQSKRSEKIIQIIKAVFLNPKLTRNMALVLIFLILFGTFSAFVPRQYDEPILPLADEQTDTEEGEILGEKTVIDKIPLTAKEVIGRGFAVVALFFGLIFFIYSLKYYFSSVIVLLASQALNGEKPRGLGKLFYRLFFRGKGKNGLINNGNSSIGFLPNLTNGNHKNSDGNWQPFVSIHLAFYNEKKVANRILTACTSFDYPNYEVIVADDSDDETVEILDKWKKHPRVKIIHRDNRSGYKGMALQEAIKQMDPKAEFVVVFDADFIPYPDTLKQFLKYFQIAGGNGNGNGNGNGIKSYKDTNIAAVQGYQWHVLNKNENWITRSVRSEFAGSYVVERPGREIMGSLKQIAGSVYMIRSDVLKSYGWTDSLTEDFELTMRIHRDGWKVIFTPYIQAPAECVSTLKRLIRQRMRWAEGHTRNVRRYFWDLIRSPYMNRREKAEFIYLAPYYLQSAFLLIGTTCWFISDIVLQTQLPFWTALWGWSLVFVNLVALPLLNSVGLFFEESPEKDYLGIFSFVSLTYIVAPFQAMAALKGLFQKKPGTWFRTPKSGHITDLYFRSRYRRWLSILFPRKGRGKKRAPLKSPYLKLATSNNQFSQFKVKKRKKAKVISTIVTLVVIGLTTFLNLLSFDPSISVPTPKISRNFLTPSAQEIGEDTESSVFKKIELVDPNGDIIDLSKIESVTPEQAEIIRKQLRPEDAETGQENPSQDISKPKEERELEISATNPTTEFYLIDSGQLYSGTDYDENLTDLSSLYSGGSPSDEKSASPDPPWIQSNSDGFGVAGNVSVQSIVAANGYVYAGVYNGENGGAEIWRCANTSGCNEQSDWAQVNDDGFGDTYNDSAYLSVADGKIWVGTQHTEAGGELWSCDETDCNEQSDWDSTINNGFEDSSNVVIMAVAEAGDYVYAGTRNTTGGELWRCAKVSSCDAQTDWAVVVDNGFDTDDIHLYPRLEASNNYLYVGTRNANSEGGAVYRCAASNCDAEVDFSLVNARGFGDAAGNDQVFDFIETGGYLYAGVVGEGEAWRCDVAGSDCNASGDWSQVNTDGFGDSNNASVYGFAVLEDYLYASGMNTTTGSEVWRCPTDDCDAQADWEQVNTDGWGDSNASPRIYGIAATDNYVFTGNRDDTNGAPVYRYSGHGKDGDVTIAMDNTGDDYWWYSRELPALGGSTIDIPAGTYSFDYYQTASNLGLSDTVLISVSAGYCNDDASNATICDEAGDFTTKTTGARTFDTQEAATGLYNISMSDWDTAKTCTTADPCRLWIRVEVDSVGGSGSTTMGYNGKAANYISHLNMPSLEIPESWIFLAIILVLFLPFLKFVRKRYDSNISNGVLGLIFLAVISSQLLGIPFGDNTIKISESGLIEKLIIPSYEQEEDRLAFETGNQFNPLDESFNLKKIEDIEGDQDLDGRKLTFETDKAAPADNGHRISKILDFDQSEEKDAPPATNPGESAASSSPEKSEETKAQTPPEKTRESEDLGEPIDNPVKMAKNLVNEDEGSVSEFIFEKQPEVSVKQDMAEISLTTLSAEGLGWADKETTGFRKDGQITYPDVFENIDLRYTLVSWGLLEEFIVNEPIKISAISQKLELENVSLLSPEPGHFIFTDNKTKEEKFRLDTPKMYELDNQTEVSFGIRYQLEKENNGKYIIHIVINEEGREWLADPDRVYPVAIDPSVIISGTISSAETSYGSQQRKLIYSSSSSAWYAFHSDGNVVYYKKCLASTLCDDAADWSSNVQISTEPSSYNPSAWINPSSTGKIYVTFIQDPTPVPSRDRVTFRTIDTASSDTLGTHCYSSDFGSAASTNMSTIAVVNGVVYVAFSDTGGGTSVNIYSVSSETSCTNGTNWTSIISGSGLTASDRPVLMDGYYTVTGPTTHPALHMVYQDGNLSHSVYVDDGSPDWDVFNTTISSETNTYYSLTGDGTSGGKMFVMQANASGADLYSFDSGTANQTAWTTETDPFTSKSNVLGVSLAYNSTDDDINASIICDATEQAYFRGSDAGTISWDTEYSYGFTTGDLDNISSPPRTPSAGLAVVLRQGLDFKFAVIPEAVWFLIPFIAFLPKQVKQLVSYIKGRKRKKKRIPKGPLWGRKFSKLFSVFGFKKKK